MEEPLWRKTGPVHANVDLHNNTDLGTRFARRVFKRGMTAFLGMLRSEAA